MKPIFLALLLALFTSQTHAATALFDDLAEGGLLAPLTRLSGTPSEMVLDAPGGLWGTGSGALSTTFDLDPITITFASPVRSATLRAGIIDLAYFGFGGTLQFDSDIGSQTFALTGIDPILYTGAAPFSSLTLSILTFDPSFSAVAFVGINSVSTVLAPIPLPAGGLLLLCALASGFGLRHAQQRRA